MNKNIDDVVFILPPTSRKVFFRHTHTHTNTRVDRFFFIIFVRCNYYIIYVFGSSCAIFTCCRKITNIYRILT